MFVWGYLGLLWALINLGLLNGDAGPKAMVPIMPPFFRLGSPVFPGWKNTVFFIACRWERGGGGGGGGGGGVNAYLFQRARFQGFSIFCNAFSTAFGVSHGFVTPIKCCRMTDSFMSLAGYEF